MIHPQYWSLHSIYIKLFPKKLTVMSPQDIAAYSTLDVRGKTVLDVGAYNGDSARLFLKNGARKVIAIECNPDYARLIDLPDVEVIVEPFRLEHLSIPHDCAKFDIEGWEALLIPVADRLKPTVLESHTWWHTAEFKKRGFAVMTDEGPTTNTGVCMMCNYGYSGRQPDVEGGP
jgi:hypothetical protein